MRTITINIQTEEDLQVLTVELDDNGEIERHGGTFKIDATQEFKRKTLLGFVDYILKDKTL